MWKLGVGDGEEEDYIRIALPPVHGRGYFHGIGLAAIKGSRDVFCRFSYECQLESEYLMHPHPKTEWMEEALHYPQKMGLEDKFSSFKGNKLSLINLDRGINGRGPAWIVWAGEEGLETVEQWDKAIIYATADSLEGEELQTYMPRDSCSSKGICTKCDEPLTSAMMGLCLNCMKAIRFDLDKIRSKPLPAKLKKAINDWASCHPERLKDLVSWPPTAFFRIPS